MALPNTADGPLDLYLANEIQFNVRNKRNKRRKTICETYENKAMKEHSVGTIFRKTLSEIIRNGYDDIDAIVQYKSAAIKGIESIEKDNELRYREHLLFESQSDSRPFYAHFVTHFWISPFGEQYDEAFIAVNMEPIRKNVNPLSEVGATHYISYSVINLSNKQIEEFLVINVEPITSYNWKVYPRRPIKMRGEVEVQEEKKPRKKDRSVNKFLIQGISEGNDISASKFCYFYGFNFDG